MTPNTTTTGRSKSTRCPAQACPIPGLTQFSNYSSGSGALPINVALSGSGTVLGQVLLTLNTITLEAEPTTGGAPIFSSAFSGSPGSLSSSGSPSTQISPDGTLIATSTDVITAGVNPGTNILRNGSLATAVTGYPIGWIDDGHLLVNTYAATKFGTTYAGCSVYSPTGESSGPCRLPEVTAFQAVTSDTIYAVNLAEILSVSTGDVSWTSGDSASNSVGAVAGNRVVFVSGTQVLAQGY